jgi:hypothetical protein
MTEEIDKKIQLLRPIFLIFPGVAERATKLLWEQEVASSNPAAPTNQARMNRHFQAPRQVEHLSSGVQARVYPAPRRGCSPWMPRRR